MKCEREFCEKNGIKFYNFGIKDMGVPDLLDAIVWANHIAESKSFYVHCKSGHGRTGVMAVT